MSFQPYPLAPSHLPLPACCHKITIGCALAANSACCACVDLRPNAPAYSVYIDGEGVRYHGTRWGSYCWRCRDYWENISFNRCTPPSTFTSTFIPPTGQQSVMPPSNIHNLNLSSTPHSQSSTSTQEPPLSPRTRNVRIEVLRTELTDARDTLEILAHGFPGLRSLPMQTDNPNSGYQHLNLTPDQTRTLGTQDGYQFSPAWISPASPSGSTRYFTDSAPNIRRQELEARQRAYLEAAYSNPQAINPNTHQASLQTQQPNRRENRRVHPATVLATREEMEDPNYQSPIGTMFGREYESYQIAEATRRQQIAEANTRNQLHDPSHMDVDSSHPNPLVPHGHLPIYSPTDEANPFNSAYPRPTSHHLTRGRRHLDRSAPADLTNQLYPRDYHQNPGLQLNGNLPPPPAAFERWLHHQTSSRRSMATYSLPDSFQESEDESEVLTFDNQERPTPMKPEDMMVNLACTICKEHLVDTIVIPCMHAVMCHWCAELQLPGRRSMPSIPRDRSAKCPVCRTRVKQKAKIFHS